MSHASGEPQLGLIEMVAKDRQWDWHCHVGSLIAFVYFMRYINSWTDFLSLTNILGHRFICSKRKSALYFFLQKDYSVTCSNFNFIQKKRC